MRYLLALVLPAASWACGPSLTTFGGDGPAPTTTSTATPDSGKPPGQDAGADAAMSDASVPVPGQPSLQMVSGTGAVVPTQWPATDPMRVRVLDKDSKPMVGETVTWTATSSVHIQAFGNVSTTDADGIAQTTFNAFGINPNLAYEEDTITANWNGLTLDFGVIITQVPTGAFASMPPLVTFSVPDGTHDMGTVKAGATVSGGIQGLAVMQQGPGYGQGVPHWGLRLTDNSDRLAPAKVSCVGGTAIADPKGNVSCDVVVPSTPGDYYFTLFAGGALYWSDGHVKVVP